MPPEPLSTKLHPPRPRRDVVERPRLTDRLDRITDAKLTLVSAPPGFGKTTIVAGWCAASTDSQPATAWLSLEPTDAEPGTFWTAFVAAVRAVMPEVGAGARALLDGGEPRVDLALSSILEDLAALPSDLVVVLDDFHVVESPSISEGVAFVLDHLPARVHLVIITRSDPALPLARMRVRGELVEIRASDLRFTADEAAAYLNGLMGLGLSGTDVAALEARTEGWIAALQLAALSMQGRDDVASFIASFAGDDRYVVDYLVDEVLDRQSPAVRDFLLRTAVLDRLTGRLCDALTGDTGGAAMLEALDRANLFLVPLDDRRRWYRYHHLFADLLRARLLEQQPDRLPELHRRASAWYESNGDVSETISHALAGGDFERAAGLIELAAHDLRRNRQEAALRRWLDALPEGLFWSRPVLAIAHAGALLATGELRRVDIRLADAERWVAAGRDDASRIAAIEAGMLVLRTEVLGHLPSAIALYRAALARIRGDLPGVIAYARAALEYADENLPSERGGASGLLGLAHWTSGDLNAALEAWAESLRNLERAGQRADVLGGSIAVADIHIAQGDLTAARRTYERGLAMGEEADRPPLRGSGDMHVGLGELHLERNDLAAARRHLDASAKLGEPMGLPQNAYRWRVAMARVHEAEGDLDGALELLDEAEQWYVSDFFPEVRPIGALRARLWVAQGRASEALAWARERGLSAEDELTYLHEFEHITLARALLAVAGSKDGRSDARQVLGLLGRLLEAAESGGRGHSVIELLALQALALRAEGRRGAAAAALDRALALAEPEGYIRLFLGEGLPMTTLLREAARAGTSAGYAGHLLAALDAAPGQTPARQPLFEPLSARELDVLRLLATDLDGPGIARELVLSLNTIRTHTRNIFAKLGVNSRRAAVRRAAELRLLARTRYID